MSHVAALSCLDLKTFRDDGYLQESNRVFFHPLGLALAVRIDDAGNRTLEVLDYRSDPEGVVFDGGLAEKADRVKAIADSRRAAREKSLGFWQQPAIEP